MTIHGQPPTPRRVKGLGVHVSRVAGWTAVTRLLPDAWLQQVKSAMAITPVSLFSYVIVCLSSFLNWPPVSLPIQNDASGPRRFAAGSIGCRKKIRLPAQPGREKQLSTKRNTCNINHTNAKDAYKPAPSEVATMLKGLKNPRIKKKARLNMKCLVVNNTKPHK